jgi:hypothetical protein
MESLFLLALGEEEFLAALAMTGLEAFFNKLLGVYCRECEMRKGARNDWLRGACGVDSDHSAYNGHFESTCYHPCCC